MVWQKCSPFVYLLGSTNQFEHLAKHRGGISFRDQPQYVGNWIQKADGNPQFSGHRSDRKKSKRKRKNKYEAYPEASRNASKPFVSKKKTHIHQFLLIQKKRHKRPTSLPLGLLLGPKVVRHGCFGGYMDNRLSRCPFRGASRRKCASYCRNCACQSLTIYLSPLSSEIGLKPPRENLSPFLNAYNVP